MLDNETVVSYLFCGNGLMQSSSLVVKRSALMSMNIDEATKRHQDWDVVIDIWSRGGKFIFIDRVLGGWNVGGAWSVGNKESYNFSKKWMIKNRKFFQNGSEEQIGFAVTVLLPKLIKSFSIIECIDLIKLLSRNPFYAFGKIVNYTWKKLSSI
jgi:hypothetical protein